MRGFLRFRWPGLLGMLGSILGVVFSAVSAHDYILHLDRQLHGSHCSYLPGIVQASEGANACTQAMYSPYAAVFRRLVWGGIPISLFAIGAFLFFLVSSLYLAVRSDVPRYLWKTYGITACSPALVSLGMFLISLIKLQAFCKLCVGIYVASALVAASGIGSLLQTRLPQEVIPALGDVGTLGPAPDTEQKGNSVVILNFLMALMTFVLVPPSVYLSSLPDYRPYLASCGELTYRKNHNKSLIEIPTLQPKRPALLVIDPLCPTCKALHQRLITENVFEKLELHLALFPLDNECNWMVDRPLHPGACVLSRAILCSDKKAREVLEWTYDNQEELAAQGKQGKQVLQASIDQRFPGLQTCMESKKIKQQLERVLQFAVKNKWQVSTPQLFLNGKRICDEDSDLGLPFTLRMFAPELF
jgi:uncharacterized membrane protein